MIRQYAGRLAQEIKLEMVILYGSHARGNPFEESDIDLVVVSDAFQGMNFLERLEFLALRWPFPKAAEILGYTSAEFEELSHQWSIVAEARRYGRAVFVAEDSVWAAKAPGGKAGARDRGAGGRTWAGGRR